MLTRFKYRSGRMGTSLQENLIRLTFVGLSCSPAVALAQTQWMSCPVPADSTPNIHRPADLPAPAVYIEANSALFNETGISEMSGDVHISQDDRKMRADNATYERTTSHVTGKGHVYLSTTDMLLHGDEFDYNIDLGSGEFKQADYSLITAEGRGTSKRIVRESPALTRLEQASYTTCPTKQPAWSINSPDIRLYHTLERGTARNLTFRVHNTPILYLPYLSFPLTDKRKSGFLFPSIGSSTKTGLQVGAPYYFNLAPNYDMTLTPTIMSNRGLQLGSEFRYLTEKHNGTFNYVLLPDDRASDAGSRYYFNAKNNSQLSSNSSLTLQAEGVSDSKYFVDLGNSLQATSVVNLERRLQYQTSGENWTFSALTQDYQVLDGGTKPHARLPQLLFNYRPITQGNKPTLEMESEYTKFAGSQTATNGSRFDIKTRASKNFSNDAAYIKPSLSLRHSQYALDDDNNKRISRTLPTATVDTGVVFERNVRQGKYLQTLEPRLYYTYTPYKDQSAIPVFDSSENGFSYGQLFTENRFTGKDRIEDANRLSLSLTTRLQNQQDGSEIFHASAGQIYHFDDRKVTLPGQTAQVGKRSELVLETGGQINKRTNISSTTLWDADTKTVTANQLNLRYKDDKKRIFNVGYTETKGSTQALKTSFSIPIKERWKAIGSSNRDLLNNRNLENVVGAEYESCCWKTRVAARNYLLPDNISRDNAVFIEFELKGLGNFGSGTSDLLKERVYGYE
jgi:LPS-assembly protein